MAATLTQAELLLHGDRSQIRDLASRLIVPEANNFIERPWGGMGIREFKRLCTLPDQVQTTGFGIGEAFELAAFDDDEEARAHPSRLRFGDGSRLSLPALLERSAEPLLGPDFVERHGACFPLLPKTLDIRELLSVQGHPSGNVEAYIIIDAEPGATIRLGFREDIEAPALQAQLDQGLRQQRQLLELLGPDSDLNALQQQLSPWFSDRRSRGGRHPRLLESVVAAENRAAAADLLDGLKRLFWDTLDRMNVVPVSAGQVIYNATPARLLQAGGPPASAEVHALGNPERREILALEIRRPGPTFRAWDNVRFPIRPVDVEAAIGALNLRRTEPSEFIVELAAVPGRPGTFRSVESEYFSIEHLRPAATMPVRVPAQPPHSLHVLRGEIEVTNGAGRSIGRLASGQSAIVPIGVGAYTVRALGTATDVVKVNLPDGV